MKKKIMNNEMKNCDDMLDEYDFSKAQRSPYAGGVVKKQISIRLKPATVAFFQMQSEKTGLPYQTIINLYLDDCAANKRELTLSFDK